jgi:hypothetical protein
VIVKKAEQLKEVFATFIDTTGTQQHAPLSIVISPFPSHWSLRPRNETGRA